MISPVRLIRSLVCPAIAALCVAAPSQTTKILPASAATKDANDVSYYPFGLDAARLQEVIDGSAIAPGAVRLTGNVVGEAPFEGTLSHRGWRADSSRRTPR